ncbi:hypothetical protein JCM10908_006103 [Rhodotorula pacifica]|uniref:Gti1/Pac2 family protein n=1 Tax=Rhodotorula pacifica TaxID=1495444 RepID=UPI00317FEFD1
MQADMTRAGHSYFGVVSSAQEAHAILEASKLGLLPRVTRRLTDEERTRFVRAGAVFVWEEEEAGIRRWTDHIKWSPSRVSGAFLTYTEVPNRGDDGLIKQSFSAADANGSKMHLIAYTSKAAFAGGSLPLASRDPLVQHMLAQRTRSGQDPRAPPDVAMYPEPASSGQHTSGDQSPTPSSSGAQTLFFDTSRSHSGSMSTQASTVLSSSAAEVVRSPSVISEPSAALQTSHIEAGLGARLPIAERRKKGQSPHILHRTESGATFGSDSDQEHTRRYDPVRDGPSSAPPTATHFPFPTSETSTSSSSWPHISMGRLSMSSTHSGSPPTTRASPFDANPRQLPPLELPAPNGLPIPCAESPSWTFDSPFSPLRDADTPRTSSQVGLRVAEDHRQLGLLGRDL